MFGGSFLASGGGVQSDGEQSSDEAQTENETDMSEDDSDDEDDDEVCAQSAACSYKQPCCH